MADSVKTPPDEVDEDISSENEEVSQPQVKKQKTEGLYRYMKVEKGDKGGEKPTKQLDVKDTGKANSVDQIIETLSSKKYHPINDAGWKPGEKWAFSMMVVKGTFTN
jgi:hypothetical protein